MAAPNILEATTHYSKTAVLVVTTTATAILTNSVSSGKVLKVNGLWISNVDGTNSADITIDIYKSSTAYNLAKTITVPADATIDFLSRYLILEEGDLLRLTASADGDLQAVCSYEQISLTSDFLLTDIPDLQLWLDASDSSTLYDATGGGSLTASSGTVRRWIDKSGKGNNVTGSSGPTRTASGQNGLDVLTFSSNVLTSTYTISIASQFTLSAVIKFATSGGQIGVAFGNTSSYGCIGLEANQRTAGLYSSTVGSNLTSTEDYAIGGTVVAAAKSLIVIFGSGVATLYLNGVSVATVSRATTINASTGLSVGAYFSNGYGLNGFICEIAAYSRAISAPELATLNSYYTTKWGIT
jgi:hypothetical protein